MRPQPAEVDEHTNSYVHDFLSHLNEKADRRNGQTDQPGDGENHFSAKNAPILHFLRNQRTQTLLKALL